LEQMAVSELPTMEDLMREAMEDWVMREALSCTEETEETEETLAGLLKESVPRLEKTWQNLGGISTVITAAKMTNVEGKRCEGLLEYLDRIERALSGIFYETDALERMFMNIDEKYDIAKPDEALSSRMTHAMSSSVTSRRRLAKLSGLLFGKEASCKYNKPAGMISEAHVLLEAARGMEALSGRMFRRIALPVPEPAPRKRNRVWQEGADLHLMDVEGKHQVFSNVLFTDKVNRYINENE
jgi:hypothetical protein